MRRLEKSAEMVERMNWNALWPPARSTGKLLFWPSRNLQCSGFSFMPSFRRNWMARDLTCPMQRAIPSPNHHPHLQCLQRRRPPWNWARRHLLQRSRTAPPTAVCRLLQQAQRARSRLSRSTSLVALFLANESRGHTWIPIAAALHALCDTDSCCNNCQCHRATTTLQCLEVTPTSDTQSPWKELNPIGYYR